MKKNFARKVLSALLASLLSLAPCATAAQGGREHLTPEEIELVRETQALDQRVGVFVRAAERRLLSLTDPPAAARLVEKDAGKWGEFKGTRAQLLSDVAGILDEAITNIDDASIHSEKSPLIPKALGRLSEAARRFLPQLTSLVERAEDERERAAVDRALEQVQEILDAAAKHPTEAPKEDKKEGKKKKS